MAVLMFEFDDSALGVVIEAVCATYGYQDKIRDPNDRQSFIPNPQSKPEFARAHVIGHLNQVTRDYVSAQAVEAARKAATDQAAVLVELTEL